MRKSPGILPSLLIVILFLSTTAPNLHAAKKGTGVPRFDPLVAKGVAYLKAKGLNSTKHNEASLAAYACFKAGESPESPAIKAIIDRVLAKASGGYKPGGYEHIYESGIDAMLLADTDPNKHRSALAAIAKYIQGAQKSDGSWSSGNDPGDVSMSQYAILGLWAAHRAEVAIDPVVLQRAAQWHLKNFNPDGGFTYRPGTTVGPAKGASHPNITAGALGSLAVVRLLLFPPQEKKKDTKLFDVAEKIKPKTKPSTSAFPGFSPSIGRGAVEDGVRKSFGWTSTRFAPNINQPGKHPIYYYYALERAFALTEAKEVRGVDWYMTSGDYLATIQLQDGSWKGHSEIIGTSFAILFYMRSTSRILGKAYGAGLLQASRGLPSDLSRAFDPDAPESEKKVKLDPLDDLLAALEKAPQGDISDKDAEALAKKQKEIVEKILNGDREELVGQVDRLKTLATNPNAEVRRIALWALGRSGDMMVSPILIKGLKDVDVAVMIEARFALCCVSRRANGFGLPSDPLEELGGASQEEKTAAAIAWSDRATSKWQKWWFKVRPYDLRDDLEEAALPK